MLNSSARIGSSVSGGKLADKSLRACRIGFFTIAPELAGSVVDRSETFLPDAFRLEPFLSKTVPLKQCASSSSLLFDSPLLVRHTAHEPSDDFSQHQPQAAGG